MHLVQNLVIPSRDLTYMVKYLFSIDMHYMSFSSTAGDVISFPTRTSVRQTQSNVGMLPQQKITQMNMGALVRKIFSTPQKVRICLQGARSFSPRTFPTGLFHPGSFLPRSFPHQVFSTTVFSTAVFPFQEFSSFFFSRPSILIIKTSSYPGSLCDFPSLKII